MTVSVAARPWSGRPPWVHVRPKVRYSTSRRSGFCHRVTHVIAHVMDGRIYYAADWMCGHGTGHAVLLATPGDLEMCKKCSAEGYPVVYRHYDDTGDLLYIGCTDNLYSRALYHRGSASWWPLVAEERTRLEYFPTPSDALAAERKAIRAEVPRWNVTGNPQRTGSAA